MKRVPIRKDSTHRRAAVAVATAAMLVVMLGMAALAIDVGYLYKLCGETQNTADAGALAGATVLQADDWASAYDTALDFVAQNQQGNGYLSLDDQVIEIGRWDSINQVFAALDPAEWEQGAFAVRVAAAHNDASLFFALILGTDSSDVMRDAVAVGSGPCGGIWGLEGVRVHGDVETDSYISTEEDYDPATARKNGDICSGRDVDGMGSLYVKGDIMAGFGYEVDIRGDAATITGMTSATIDGVSAPPVDPGDVVYNNSNETIGLTDRGREPFSSGWNMSIGSQDNLTLGAGTYFFDSMRIRAGGTVTTAGPTTIYVAGNIDAIGGTIVNATAKPANLTILCMGTQVTL
ncbi:MAG: pilus assembly protein TadG-related protein, partial [Planctomycetota bacterium]